MNKKLDTDEVKNLYKAVVSLKSEEECMAFFEDLCTINEILSLSQRFEVAGLLRPVLSAQLKPRSKYNITFRSNYTCSVSKLKFIC